MSWHPPSYKTAVKLQRLIDKAADDPEASPRDLGLLSRALTELEEMKRKLKMKPLPKAVDVSRNGKLKSSTPVELPEPTE